MGASSGPGVEETMRYPDFLINGEIAKGLKGGKKDKAKL
jgi:hypothetical protein